MKVDGRSCPHIFHLIKNHLPVLLLNPGVSPLNRFLSARVPSLWWLTFSDCVTMETHFFFPHLIPVRASRTPAHIPLDYTNLPTSTSSSCFSEIWWNMSLSLWGCHTATIISVYDLNVVITSVPVQQRRKTPLSKVKKCFIPHLTWLKLESSEDDEHPHWVSFFLWTEVRLTHQVQEVKTTELSVDYSHSSFFVHCSFLFRSKSRVI